MNSRVSWSVEGIDPSVREKAEAAARRAGMSLNDWLNSTIRDAAPADYRASAEQRPPSQETPDVADIHQRLDSITRQIEQLSRPAPRQDAPRGEQGVARQLNDAISRLDARLSQISNPAPAKPAQLEDTHRQAEMVERAAAQIYSPSVYSPSGYRPSLPLNPASLDLAIAEITARQSELEAAAPRPLPPRHAPPIAPAMTSTMAPAMAPVPPAGPDFSTLERHLFKITSQIEALQRPDGNEQSIAAFRSELAEIRLAITEAMPRRAIESIENEIRSLSRRIDDTRQNGIDGQALAGIERALAEIREVLRTLTPAEQLAGYDEAIRNLGAKLDLILRASDDPSTIHKLEDAIAALRSIVSNVASNDALARLSDDVHTLSSKVDQLARAGDNSDTFAVLEQRIAALTSTLESRERPVGENSEHLEGAVRALSERLDRMPVGNDSASAFAHLEQRVSYLLERLEASTDPRAGHLGRVEDGLQDILRHLETQQVSFAALKESSRNTAAPPDGDLINLVKRELSDIRFSQSETDRHTQDSLEAVHNTLGHVVDRLAMIEGDLRTVRIPPVAPQPEMPPTPQAALLAVAPRLAMPPQAKPELQNPAAAQPFTAAPREFQAAPSPMAAAAASAPRAINEILEAHTAPSRAAIEPDLPPDHPLEPGTRPSARMASPSERIAASENAISGIPTSPPEPVSTSSFIAAARRAAQAAAAAPPADKA
ncbi:MAG: localization factor PodJL, partial [Bradyrhizobium sp.]|nr:localization factor PodJL [Bradyrhizobium sp.]